MIVIPSFAHGADVYGSGLHSCGKWSVESKTDSMARRYYIQWVLGFVTSMSVTSEALNKDMKSSDSSAIIAWMDNFCVENPLISINQASQHLTNELWSE